MKINNKKQNKDSSFGWFASIFILTFILSILFSYISSVSIKDISIVIGILILLIIIFIGVIFDIIGVAVIVGNEHEFHAKASKKLKGSKTAIKLIRNSHKVSTFCADVIGDISGVLSGAISALIAIKIMESYNLSFNIQFIISSMVASLTVGSKAVGKVVARNNSTKIVNVVSTLLNITKKK